MSLHIATGLALLGIATRRLEEALGTLASHCIMCNELLQAEPRVEVRSWTALGSVSLHIATGLALLGIASRRLEEALGTLASQCIMCNELLQAEPRVEVRSWTALGTGHLWVWCVTAHCYWPGVARLSIPTSRGISEKTGYAGFNGQRVMAGCTPRRGA